MYDEVRHASCDQDAYRLWLLEIASLCVLLVVSLKEAKSATIISTRIAYTGKA
jgi:hypothetical protein